MTAVDTKRFWGKVEKTEGDGCWLWRAGVTKPFGYGAFWVDGKNVGAHRISWQLAHEEVIPEGLFVLHRCDSPACVRPEHLFLGTPLDNMLDMVAKGRHSELRKTHCKRGHPLSGDNLYRRKDRPGRECRACRRVARQLVGQPKDER